MKNLLCTVAVLGGLTALNAQTPSAPAKPKSTRNSLIYPPAEAAQSAISYDGAGFIVNGKRAYIASGTIHFARVPRALWRDRLLRLKQAGFNCVETYVFWNFHETRENQVDFKGDKDLGAYLSLAQELGLYALVRVGPYCCAEWDLGGYPVWTSFKTPVNVRTNDPEWLKLNDHWYDSVLPIVAKHQIHRGGNVILLQLENEHPLGWGVVKDDPYFVHLAEQAVKHGIEIPYFMSGLNHGGSPSPGNIDPAKQPNPWFSTEFWAGWFDSYRTLTAKKQRDIDNANWTILAHGGGGHNFYMLHGGSNFDTWSDDSTGSSYDFGAAIGQAGDLRPWYYKMKRANLLAAAFPDIVAHSTDDLPAHSDFATGKDVEILGARKSDAGTFVFLRNGSNDEAMATLKTGGSLRLPSHSHYPLPENVVLGNGAKLVASTLPVLTAARNNGCVTAVFYGQPGETGMATVSLSPGEKTSAVKLQVPASGVVEQRVGESVRILVIPQDLTLRTWLTGAPDKQFLVLGPGYVSSVIESGGKVTVCAEQPFGTSSCRHVAVYGGRGQEWHLKAADAEDGKTVTAPALENWQAASATEASPEFDDSNWLKSEAPKPMGADGDPGAFVWYRATVHAPAGGRGKISLKAKDYCRVFVNGQPADNESVFQADFKAGNNSIAIFVSHKGRNKVYNYLGKLADRDVKGITGPVTLELGGNKVEITGWKMRGGETPAWIRNWGTAEQRPGLPAFFRARFETHPPGATGVHPILRWKYTENSRGMVWINGHALGRYPEKIRIDSLYLPECWLKDGGNELIILDENGASPASSRLVVEKEASRTCVKLGDASCDPAAPIVVPQENPVRDLAAMNRGNIAFRALATASESKNGAKPNEATDGDAETMWAAPDKAKAPWLQVDLGKSMPVKVCEILWNGESKRYKYTLEASDDGQAWTKLGDQTTAVPTSPDSPSELSRLNLSGAAHRYLRVTILDGRSLAIAELRAFAP